MTRTVAANKNCTMSNPKITDELLAKLRRDRELIANELPELAERDSRMQEAQATHSRSTRGRVLTSSTFGSDFILNRHHIEPVSSAASVRS